MCVWDENTCRMSDPYRKVFAMLRIVYHRWTRVSDEEMHDILGPDGDTSYRGLLEDGTPVIVSEARGIAVSLLMPHLTPCYTVFRRHPDGKGHQARLVKV